MNGEPTRRAAYQKDPDQERDLADLNRLLEPIENQWISEFVTPHFPTVFVVGVPRCGSTVLAQLLASTGSFNYVSNFVARFWMAPFLGMTIEKSLRIREREERLALESTYGVTPGWLGPHEFGYFWNRWFGGYETNQLNEVQLSRIDAGRLCRELSAMEHVYTKPLFFKNLLCDYQISFLASILPQSFFVYCRRDPIYVMQSLYEARLELYGNIQTWCSARPVEYLQLQKMNPYEQIAGQVYYTERAILSSLDLLLPSRYRIVDYESLCDSTRIVLQGILDRVHQTGHPVNFVWDRIPEQLSSQNRIRIPEKELHLMQKEYENLHCNQTQGDLSTCNNR